MNNTLSLYEDNAGGLSLLRHKDNAVFVGLETIYSNGGSTEGKLFDKAETEYWIDMDVDADGDIKTDEWHYRNSDGMEYRFEPAGDDAECFERDRQTPNGINLIATFDGTKWEVTNKPGTNGGIAIGVDDRG